MDHCLYFIANIGMLDYICLFLPDGIARMEIKDRSGEKRLNL